MMKKVVLLIASFALICGCSKNAKKTLGITETLPDEFQVSKSKDLVLPPHYKLAEPTTSKQNKKSDKMSDSEKALLEQIN